VAAPYNVALQGQVENVALDALQDIGIDATLALDNTDLAAIGDNLPPLPPISTQLQVSGTVGELALKQSEAAPYNVSLQAQLAKLLRQPALDAKLQLTQADLTQIRPELPPLPPPTTRLQVSGDLDQLQLKQTVAAPYNVSLEATLADLLATPAIHARLQLAGTQLDKVKSDLPPLQLDTTVQVDGELDDLGLQLQAVA